ncbi:hypothetical protein DPEC_G00228230 [Dallia pectoralis]|uniref:Uncharacterized protein n=1 Tax=Dallia pectoralis TaxID=75939 RepID=A0ACC2G1E1_DALPE|nr:hypothetical protein DPEC_G00228230 [Dallia pectoralis]
MGRDRGGNALTVSSKKQWRERGGHGGDLEKLCSALEAERCLNRQAERRFSLELRRLREEAEQEQQRALRELSSRHERQKALELRRLQWALEKEWATEVRLEKEREAAIRQARELLRRLSEVANNTIGKCGRCSRRETLDREPGCAGNGASYRKLERLLERLHEQLEDGGGEQAVVLQRLRQELDLEKGFYLCHQLEAHRQPGTGKGSEQNQSFSGDARVRSNSCVDRTGRTDLGKSPKGSLARTKSKSPFPPPADKRTSREPGTSTSGREPVAAAHRSSPLEGDTCPDISPSGTTSPPCGDRDLQAASPGSEKSSASKSSDGGNMVVSMTVS